MPEARAAAQSDDSLVTAAKAAVPGDTRAFEELVGRYQRQILANCRHLTNAHHDAEDLTQEVFVKAYFALERFEGRSAFKTWLQRLKVNHCLNYLRRQRRVVFTELDATSDTTGGVPHDEPTVPRDLELRDERARVTAVLDTIPDALRVPLVLRDVDELSYEQIAQTLGIGLSAAKMRVKRGREAFRRNFARLAVAHESVAEWTRAREGSVATRGT